MEYTVIGHTVNCASRVEQTNKLFNTDILITRRTFEKVHDYIEYEKKPLINMKGIEEKIETFFIKDIKFTYLELNEKIENCLKIIFNKG